MSKKSTLNRREATLHKMLSPEYEPFWEWVEDPYVIKKGVAYYAHTQSTYDTEAESKDVNLIKSLGYVVYNPNNKVDGPLFQSKGMRHFDDLMKMFDFDICFIRPLSDGSISAGASYEAMKFFELRKPVLEIPAPILPRTLSPEATREVYRWYGKRELSETDKR